MVLIVGPGDISKDLLNKYKNSEKIIACDLGARHCLKYSLNADIYVGDFDSLSSSEYDMLPKGKVVKFPAKKDKTDFECALDLVEPKSEVKALGFLGGRKDHELANIMLIVKMYQREIDLTLENESNEISYLKNSQILKKDKCYHSLIGLEDLQVTLKGFLYPSSNLQIPFGSSMGISNEIIDDQAEIILHQGRGFLVSSKDSYF